MGATAVRRPRRAETSAVSAFSLFGPSLLFCPGDRPDRYAKAAARADMVILDLEDAVAGNAKVRARESVVAAADELDPSKTIIRVNGRHTEWWPLDLAAVSATAFTTIMVPKVCGDEDVTVAAPLNVIALCESAAGVLRAPQIAAASNCVALAWGGEDLMVDLHGRRSRSADGRYHHVVEFARSSVLLAARMAGRLAIDAVFIDAADHAGLAEEAALAAVLGFDGKCCIHPDQVDAVRRAFVPTAEEVAWAQGVLAASRAARHGVFAYDGRMVDAPLLQQAETILRRTTGPAEPSSEAVGA